MTTPTARRPLGAVSPPHRPSRRSLLLAAGLAPAAGLAGCGSAPTISDDPDELVMW
ncbi:hypothetical protein [Brachybacterium alimentarium]|nr:hypothetical protein [Brachybacterium alimentarium]